MSRLNLPILYKLNFFAATPLMTHTTDLGLSIHVSMFEYVRLVPRDWDLFPGPLEWAQRACNEVETGGHGMMGWGPAASTLKDMLVRTQHARS